MSTDKRKPSRAMMELLRLFCRKKVAGQFSLIDPAVLYGHSRRTAMALWRRGLFRSLESPEGTRWTSTAAGRALVEAEDQKAKARAAGPASPELMRALNSLLED